MKSLDSIIQDFGTSKEGGLTHRRPFLNLKETSGHINWYSRRTYA
ncbi:hypothetical protein [Christiangramia sp. SM2212]|uniref:Uncharacterized protein n=1 Tax=Christiangramia sediminicola TaxID=3073267 RepID=A0ABU1EP78_9FLAO|nr:hypothetical protein [Christiangramia sp. SM2212]MDR5590195.1 hypothetical protein [Christiangramia sp. SM2212]